MKKVVERIEELVRWFLPFCLVGAGSAVIGTVVANAFGLDPGQRIALIAGLAMYGLGVVLAVDLLRD